MPDEAGAGLTAADAAPMQLRGCRGKAERDGRRGGGHWPPSAAGPRADNNTAAESGRRHPIYNTTSSTVYMWAVVYIL